jgi:hypothetical protein
VEAFPFDHFAIVYAGRFYPPKSNPAPIMAALRSLHEDGSSREAVRPWRFHYYGRQNELVRAAAERAGVQERVVLHGLVPRAESLAALRGAGVSVVITSAADQAGPADLGIVTGKVYDALGLAVPVLLIAPPGSDAEPVVQAAGGRRYSGQDAAGMASYLADLMGAGAARAKPCRDCAWPVLAAKLDGVLQRAAHPRDRLETPAGR